MAVIGELLLLEERIEMNPPARCAVRLKIVIIWSAHPLEGVWTDEQTFLLNMTYNVSFQKGNQL